MQLAEFSALLNLCWLWCIAQETILECKEVKLEKLQCDFIVALFPMCTKYEATIYIKFIHFFCPARQHSLAQHDGVKTTMKKRHTQNSFKIQF